MGCRRCARRDATRVVRRAGEQLAQTLERWILSGTSFYVGQRAFLERDKENTDWFDAASRTKKGTDGKFLRVGTGRFLGQGPKVHSEFQAF